MLLVIESRHVFVDIRQPLPTKNVDLMQLNTMESPENGTDLFRSINFYNVSCFYVYIHSTVVFSLDGHSLVLCVRGDDSG